MTRSFTRREKILLGILALFGVAALYVVLVFRPVANSLESLEAQRLDLEMQTDIAAAQLQQYNAMQKELEEIFSLPQDKLTVMPAYDNQQALMSRLDVIFLGLDPQLTFGDVTVSDGVASRPVRFTFNAPSYDRARSVLEQLSGTGWRSLLDALSITCADRTTPSIHDGPVTVTGTITFYELAE